MPHVQANCPYPAQGLYDPQHEHDACGVGFVVDIKGRTLARDRPAGAQLLINLQHRGACGCEANTGDGAGILIQMPDASSAPQAARLRRCRPPATTAPASIFLPRDPAERDRVQGALRAHRRRGGPAAARLARRADRRLARSAHARARVEPVFEQVFIGKAPATRSAASSRRPRCRFERKLYVIRKRIEHAVDALALAERDALLHRQPLVEDADLQGHADGGQIEPMFPDLADPDARVGAGAGAPALQHQHVPVLAAGASVPLHRAQRRDQHAARQHQLDARARRTAPVGSVRRRPEEGPAGHPRRRQRHGDLRQRARVPRHDRALAAARRADDDPRAVAEPRDDDRRSGARSTSTTRR